MNEYKSDTPYTEIAIAMEDFSYNGYGYFSIPTLTPFRDNENKVSEITIDTSNILNKDIEALGITKIFSSSNYYKLFVPWYLADIKRSPTLHSFDAHGSHHPAVEHTDMVALNFKGLKGTKFIVTFLGGNMYKPNIIGRVYE